jgi:hypothetical protein
MYKYSTLAFGNRFAKGVIFSVAFSTISIELYYDGSTTKSGAAMYQPVLSLGYLPLLFLGIKINTPNIPKPKPGQSASSLLFPICKQL